MTRPSVTRWKITIEYDGTPFVGWQRQENGLSVQQLVEEAIEKFSAEVVRIQGSGRTDSGVHAKGQVAHFDLAAPRDDRAVRDGLNYFLKPHPVSIIEAEAVEETFNARRDAKERTYLYRILNRRSPAALEAGRVWHVAAPLDVALMQAGAARLVGHHDFTSFRASECQAKSPLRTLDELSVQRLGDEVQITARARSFLHHQVRNMVGTLALVGQGKWAADDVTAALNACDRSQGGPTAPPDGLYFMRVQF